MNLVVKTALAGLLCLGAAGCGDAMCDPNPVGEPWKPYASLIPSNTVICGPNRVSSKKPLGNKDNYPPTQLFAYFKDADVAVAFDQSKKKLEAAGWTLDHFHSTGEGKYTMFSGTFTKKPDAIDLMVNQNDYGIQGSFKLSKGGASAK